MSKPVILTGLRANNDLHIGNYFGALLPMVDMANENSDEYQINLFVPDLHSFITPINHQTLYKHILNNVRAYIAAGYPLDKPNVRIYRQSYIPAHSELTWILDCFTGMGEMSRMTQYKDKSAENSDRVNVGIFNYPVLMAADILLYNASYVPVGDDQTQHLEFTRDIAQRMNAKFGELFIVPAEVSKQHKLFGKDQGLRIKDLADPSKKMSKSSASDKGVIFLNDSPERARKKVMSATTDSVGAINYDQVNQPGISNLIDILALLEGNNPLSVAERFKDQTQYGDFKTEAADKVVDFLERYQSKLSKVSDEQVNKVLESGEKAMEAIANETLLRVQRAVGLRPRG